MKNLPLFVTLSLVSIISTCTVGKANPAVGNFEQYQDSNSVIISDSDETETIDTTVKEVQPEAPEVNTNPKQINEVEPPESEEAPKVDPLQ